MKALLELVIAANAALFFFGAVQHAGIALGRFNEPKIVPAAIVEAICGIVLVWEPLRSLGKVGLDDERL